MLRQVNGSLKFHFVTGTRILSIDRYVVMERYRGSLASYLKGEMAHLSLETSMILWQVTSGLDHVRFYRKTLLDVTFAGKLRCALQPEKILISDKNGQIVLKLQVDLQVISIFGHPHEFARLAGKRL